MITENEIIPATGEAVTLEQAKQHLNIDADFTLDDALITVYRDAALNEAETFTGHALFQDRIWWLDNFDTVEACCFAKAAITAIQYVTGENEEGLVYENLPEENYRFFKVTNDAVKLEFVGTLPVLVLENDNNVKVTFSTTCPDAVRVGMLLRIGDFYLRREDRGTSSASTAVMDLWRAYRSKY
jgi:hypothetical protein